MKTQHDKVNAYAVVSAAQKRLVQWYSGSVRVRDHVDGRSAGRVERELLETGHYRKEGDSLALTDEGLRVLAGTMAEEPHWPGIGSRFGCNLRNVHEARTWAWLYLHADECDWHVNDWQKGTCEVFVPGERPSTWDVFARSKAAAAAAEAEEHERRVERLLQTHLGAALVDVGVLDPGNEDVFEEQSMPFLPMGQQERWTERPEARARFEIGKLQSSIAFFERRLRILAVTERRVAEAGGWDAVMQKAREAVRAAVEKADQEREAS